MTMTVLGGAIARSWGEAMWTARDLLKPQRVPVRQPGGVSINMHPGPPDAPLPLVVVVYRDSDGMLRRF